MNFILGISKEIKWKVKVVLLEVSLIINSFDIQGYQMEGESGVTRSFIDELNSWDFQRDQIEGESGVTRIMIDEVGS